jgi:hypothetical protein
MQKKRRAFVSAFMLERDVVVGQGSQEESDAHQPIL